MPCWSAENATKAYLTTLTMGERGKEPDVAEFISALAAGNNAQLMVVACGGGPAGSTVRALVAASHQTGGRVVCIVPTLDHLTNSPKMFDAGVELVIGEARDLLMSQYDAADFVLIDCRLQNHEEIVRGVSEGKRNGRVVVGYNAFRSRGSWVSCGSKTQFLPIGEGLLVSRFGGNCGSENPKRRRSRWIVKVDECTGEEHVFRVRFPQGKLIQPSSV